MYGATPVTVARALEMVLVGSGTRVRQTVPTIDKSHDELIIVGAVPVPCCRTSQCSGYAYVNVNACVTVRIDDNINVEHVDDVVFGTIDDGWCARGVVDLPQAMLFRQR